MSHRDLELTQMYRCNECGTLFIRWAFQELDGQGYDLCPNPRCHAPRNLCDPIMNEAIWWLFNHLIEHSGFDEVRRMNLREIAESQMEPWNPLYRLF